MKQEVTIQKGVNEYTLTIEDGQKVNEITIPGPVIFDTARSLNSLTGQTPIDMLIIASDEGVSHIPIPSWAFEKVKYIIIEEALLKSGEVIGLTINIWASLMAGLAAGGIPAREISRHATDLSRAIGFNLENKVPQGNKFKGWGH